ncbi:MAG: hypothetical protein MH825_02380 [Cyanobacteria bacterium]|nr:hypothetical protein [Cyanobacteriota bacterium]
MRIMTQLLLGLGTGVNGQFPWAFTAVYVAGFAAAVIIGSIAWYNSKRPAGWEGRERPKGIPKVNVPGEDTDGAD